MRMSSTAPVRLSELVATLSLVAGLGMGGRWSQVLRQTVITLRLADAARVGDGGARGGLLHLAAHLGGVRRGHQ